MVMTASAAMIAGLCMFISLPGIELIIRFVVGGVSVMISDFPQAGGTFHVPHLHHVKELQINRRLGLDRSRGRRIG